MINAALMKNAKSVLSLNSAIPATKKYAFLKTVINTAKNALLPAILFLMLNLSLLILILFILIALLQLISPLFGFPLYARIKSLKI